MRIIANLFVAVFVFLGTSEVSCYASTCSVSQSIKVEKLVSEQQNWRGLYDLYKKYPQCSTNNVVEVWGRYSEVIAKILAYDWDQFDDLLKLSRSDTGFNRFILDHIADQTLSKNVLEKIKDNVKKSCPSDGVELCKKIESAAE